MSDDTKEEWNVDRLGALVEAFNDWDDEYIKTDGNNMSVIHTHEDLRNAFIAGFQAGKRWEEEESYKVLCKYTLGG